MGTFALCELIIVVGLIDFLVFCKRLRISLGVGAYPLFCFNDCQRWHKEITKGDKSLMAVDYFCMIT